MANLNGKVALVTGGNSGIGLATAKLLKKQGAKVVITARSAETFAKSQKEYGSEFDVIQTDVSKIGDLDKLYSAVKTKHGGLDILFANAGVALFRPTIEIDEAFFDNQFDTNVKGLYFTVAKALPLLKPGSSVVLNASVAASKGMAGGSVYSATKAAVRSFARTWTAEVPHARFNVLSPGPIETPIYGKMGMSADEVKGFSDQMIASVPAKRFGTAEEMAKVVLFLASDESSYLYGADLVADGGFGQV